jgi:hypothetical protein
MKEHVASKRKFPEPPITDPGELAAYAGEHLVYEVKMFFAAAAELQGENRRRARYDAVTTSTSLEILGVPAKSWFQKMASIEGFVIHFRTLVAFLFPDRHTVLRDDVCAHHFVCGPSSLDRWVSSRGQMSESLRAAKDRADKELAHLTTERQEGITKAKTWPVDELTSDLAAVLETFLAMADESALGARARSVLADHLAIYRDGVR